MRSVIYFLDADLHINQHVHTRCVVSLVTLNNSLNIASDV